MKNKNTNQITDCRNNEARQFAIAQLQAVMDAEKAKRGANETQDWVSSPTSPSFEENGNIWELWMSFGGKSCNEAFDLGYDSVDNGSKCDFNHPALIAAFQSGVRQFKIENN